MCEKPLAETDDWRRVESMSHEAGLQPDLTSGDPVDWRRQERRGCRERVLAAIDHQEADRVRQALAYLPDNQRLAVILKYFERMNYAEISEALGVSEKAVDRLLGRAREGLRKLLKPG